jgi:hypothetical protein
MSENGEGSRIEKDARPLQNTNTHDAIVISETSQERASSRKALHARRRRLEIPAAKREPSFAKHQTIGEVTFHIAKEVNVSDDVVEAAEKGASMVWGRNTGEQADMKVVFTSKIADPLDLGDDLGIFASWDLNSDVLTVAIDSIRAKAEQPGFKDIFGEKDLVLMYCAHEAMHRVQAWRGEKVPNMFKLPADQYLNDPLEREAWIEALHVMKKVRPELSIPLKGGLNSPNISKY